MQTSLSSRRGVLRKSAIVVGAFLAGIGRAESAFGATAIEVNQYCSFAAGKCSKDQKDACRHVTGWNSTKGPGLCCECYESDAALATAVREFEKWKLENACWYSEGIVCGFYEDRTPAVAYEDPLSSPNYPCF